MKRTLKNSATPSSEAKAVVDGLSSAFIKAGFCAKSQELDGSLLLTVENKKNGRSMTLDIISQEVSFREGSMESFKTGEVIVARSNQLPGGALNVKNAPYFNSLSMHYQGGPTDCTLDLAGQVAGFLQQPGLKI